MDENQNADPTGSNPDPAGQPENPATQGPETPGPHPTGAGPRITSGDMRDLGRLRRSTTDRHVAGVAGGIARQFDIDPLIVRIAFVVLTFFGGAGLILYGACWLFVPEDDETSAPFDLEPRTRAFVLIIAGVIAALSVIGDSFDSGPGLWGVFPAVVIAAIAWVVLTRRNRRRGPSYQPGSRAGYAPDNPYAVTGHAAPPPGVGAQLAADAKADPEKYRDMSAWQVTGDPSTGYRWQRDPRKRGPKLFWIAVPLIALALGTLGVIDLAGAGVIDAAYPALALAIVAALLVLGAFWGRAGGLILLGLLLVPVTIGATAADSFEPDRITYRPTTFAEIPAGGYHLDAGDMVVDLTGITDLASLDGRVVRADVNVGKIDFIVPDDVDVVATAHVNGPGGYEIFGAHGGGIDNGYTQERDGGDDVPKLVVNGTADVGQIIVRSN
jgi:phage shock protein PspC (stress-responsive transcriptional regulator)